MKRKCAMPRTLIAAVSICLLASAAHAGDQGDPAQSCDGSTMEMVECLTAKTAQWDKRMIDRVIAKRLGLMPPA